MTVIAPPRRPDSHDGDTTVEPDRGGQARVEEANHHPWPRRHYVADLAAEVEALIREARRRMHRRRRKIAAVVIAVVAVFVGVTGLAVGRTPATSVPEPDLRTTSVEEAPAVPASRGELVASFYTHWSARGGDRWIYVYDDGRIIFRGRGWEQKRLTPEGVELLSAGIIASDILGPRRYSEPQQWGSGAFIQLRVDGVLTAAWQPPRSAEEEVDAFDRLIRQLMDFEGWLPANAWTQHGLTPYVSPGYAVCAGGEDRSFPEAGQDAVLSHLPAVAAALLRAAPRFEAINPEHDAYAGSGMMPSSEVVGCRHLTPAQSQSVIDALVRDGWGVEDAGPPAPGTRILLAERERLHPFDMSTTVPEIGRLSASFSSVLPHGVPECACYG